jgi:hypothetical protein
MPKTLTCPNCKNQTLSHFNDLTGEWVLCMTCRYYDGITEVPA